MTACGVCHRPCIPMADYEMPTCHRCDSAVAAVMTRAAITVPIRPRRKLPQWPVDRLKPCGTHAAFNRHRDRAEPVDDACRAAERVYQTATKRTYRRREAS